MCRLSEKEATNRTLIWSYPRFTTSTWTTSPRSNAYLMNARCIAQNSMRQPIIQVSGLDRIDQVRARAEASAWREAESYANEGASERARPLRADRPPDAARRHLLWRARLGRAAEPHRRQLQPPRGTLTACRGALSRRRRRQLCSHAAALRAARRLRNLIQTLSPAQAASAERQMAPPTPLFRRHLP